MLLCLLTLTACGGGGSGGGDDTDDSAPSIDANGGFSPTSAIVGGAGFTLTITGTGFTGDSVVRWNGIDRTTTYVSATTLTVEVTAADIVGVGTVDITVFNPGPDGGESSVAAFVIGYPAPTVSGLTPNVMQVGSADFILTVNGSNFVSGAFVRWNGADRTTTFVSDTELTALIPASDVTALGAVTISVLNPTPGGGESTTNQTFTVNPLPAPTTTGLNPSGVLVGGPAFSLTVNGTDFIDGNSQVFWNGVGQPTTFITDTELTAMIPASNIASTGMAQITVATVDGGVSNAQTLMINNPVPTFSDFDPTTAIAGDAGFDTLRVNGTNFNASTVVMWNGDPRATTLVSDTQVSIAITAADRAVGADVPVTVSNPAPGGGSFQQTFTIDNPVPAFGAFDPVEVTAGGPAFTLAVNGSNFNPDTVVSWNGVQQTTTFVSDTQVSIDVAANDIMSGGLVPIMVTNPVPGGGSFVENFTVNNPLPFIANLSPNSALVAGAAPTVVVNGTGFNATSVIQWDGAPRTTTFISATQLSIDLLVSDVDTVGVVDVSVDNPAPQGGSSNTVTFATTSAPVPTIANINPSTAPMGSAAFILTVTGTGFNANSVVLWGGSDRTTIFNPAQPDQLTAQIQAFDLDNDACVPVTVHTPTGGLSNQATFTVEGLNGLCDAAGVPILDDIAPRSVAAGAADFTLDVFGSGFAPTSVVQLDGVTLTTTVVSPTQLQAQVAALDVAAPGIPAITVLTPGGPGARSQPETLVVLENAADGSFADNFNRADNDDVGNGWTEKLENAQFSIQGKVVAAPTNNNEEMTYRSGLVHRPAAEAATDVEVTVEFVRRDSTIDDRFPQVHARVQLPTSSAVDTNHAYIFYLFGSISVDGFIAANAPIEGEELCTLGRTTFSSFLTTGRRYRMRLRVTGSGSVADPVVLTGIVDEFVNGVWQEFGVVNATHDVNTVFVPNPEFVCGDAGMPPPIDGAGVGAFSKNFFASEYFDAFHWREISP